ncbi:unnamed protein product [Nippostrongylus brasiliensis]|uniref:WW domain-binding protein 4 (inferred by orthology to a human protein) n=1 Tax=Nippostrongylus brasiliensis TaxID=27835 RepID=A0A0N4YVC7_NIPBR|nr:unnamed protein product [Nippostrongylus brasiliensis]
MIDHIDRDVEALLEALLMLLLTDNHRPYVTEAHVPFLETRFRMFDSYLCSMSPSGFYNYLRLYPDEFEALHARLAARLSHLPSHRAPIVSRHRLCVFLSSHQLKALNHLDFALDMLGYGWPEIRNPAGVELENSRLIGAPLLSRDCIAFTEFRAVQPFCTLQSNKVWFGDNRASIEFHERGRKHKDALAAKLRELGRASKEKEREQSKMNSALAAMEAAALKSMREHGEALEQGPALPCTGLASRIFDPRQMKDVGLMAREMAKRKNEMKELHNQKRSSAAAPPVAKYFKRDLHTTIDYSGIFRTLPFFFF